nr:hypothetical protein [Tanacetum cinerariifolium]
MSHGDTRNKDTQRTNVPVETTTFNALVSQCDGVGLESVESRLVVYQQNENVFEEDIKLLKLDVMLRDNALVELRKKFGKEKKKEMNESVPTSPAHDRYKTGEGYHAVPPPYTGTLVPLKPDLVFYDASTMSETAPTVIHVEPSLTKPTKELSQSNRPSAPIIEDWVSDLQDEYEVEHTTPAENLRKDIPKSRGHRHSWNRKACFVCKSLNHLIKDCDYYEKKTVQKPIWNHAMRVNLQHSARMTHPHSKKHVVPTAVLARSRLVPLNAVRPVTTTVSQTNVQHQRPVKHVVNKPHSPIRRPINHRSSPINSNPHQALKDKGVIDSGCSIHMTRNISNLFDFEEINRGYNAFGRNPKGGKITSKEAVNNVCYVQNKVLMTKPHNKTPYELLLGRTPSIGFMRLFGCLVTILNTLDPLGKFDEKADDGLLVGYSSMNYQPVVAWNQPNSSAGIQENLDADDEEDVGAEANFSNLETSITVSHILTTRIHKDHPVTQIIGDLSSSPQTRSMTRMVKEQGGLTQINDEDFHTYIKSFFLYGTIEEEVYVCQPLGFKDPDYPDKIYMDDIIVASTNKELCKAFEKLMNDKFQMSSIGELTFFLGLQVKKKNNRILISQDKYVAKILRKFGLTYGKSTSTPIDTEKPLLKDPDGEDVDVHIYRSMIGSLMYLTLSRPDIMFVVCACTCFKVTLKVSHLHAVKRIFRYLKDKPHLGLWYLKDSPFNLVAYSNSDYAGASFDMKFTTGGCQFLCCRLISWKCKKQTVVATSSTEAEYVADASYCAQVLWI